MIPMVPTRSRCALVLAAAAGLLAVSCGRAPAGSAGVKVDYNKETGKISQITLNSTKDGKSNVFSHMDGTSFVSIDIDNDEDGKIDRWEYYGADQKLMKIGTSRSHDGIQDSWMYPAADGSIARLELANRGGGKVTRTEYYEQGVIVRAEEDTDGDGRIDKWETYEKGVLATAAFDTRHSGQPDRTVDYRNTAAPASRLK